MDRFVHTGGQASWPDIPARKGDRGLAGRGTHRSDGRGRSGARVAHQKPAITRDPDIQGGTPVFSGTRIPVAVMLDYLADGQPLENFLEQYPSVSRENALRALQEVKGLLVAS